MNASDVMAGELGQRILAALPVRAEDRTPRIEVEIDGSRDTLRGDAYTWRDHETAGRIAASTPGITSVTNELCLFVEGSLATT